MYMGTIVETGPCNQIFKDPKHPYTKALLSSTLSLNPLIEKKKKPLILYEQPASTTPLKGCPFYPFCPQADDICKETKPHLTKTGKQLVSCHLYKEEKGETLKRETSVDFSLKS